MSRHSLHSPYVAKEITCATGKKKHIVCVVLGGSRAQGSFELMLCDTQMMNHGVAHSSKGWRRLCDRN